MPYSTHIAHSLDIAGRRRIIMHFETIRAVPPQMPQESPPASPKEGPSVVESRMEAKKIPGKESGKELRSCRHYAGEVKVQTTG